jgi:hypothetical protein
MSPGWGLTRAHAAQGGVTLEPEQGELGANFCYLGFGNRQILYLKSSKYFAFAIFSIGRSVSLQVPVFRIFRPR